jgi:DegV family protein with EDD domain
MVKVVTDSACDIPLEIARKLSITIVPLYIQFDGKTYRDGIDLNVDRLYYELAHSREIPKTSMPSPGDFIKVYSDLAKETEQIISIHLSSGYSGTCDVARLARSYIKGKCRVEVIDSNSVSVGLALIVIASAKAAHEGKNLDQIIDLLHQIIPQVRMFGETSSFPPVLKGKRLRLTRGLIFLGKIGTALRTRMLGEIYDGGRIRSPALVLGQKWALNKLKRWAQSLMGVTEIAIAYSTMPDEAEMLAERLESLVPREHILITRLGCATSTYVGPGVFAMALLSGKQRQSILASYSEHSVKLASARFGQSTVRGEDCPV